MAHVDEGGAKKFERPHSCCPTQSRPKMVQPIEFCRWESAWRYVGQDEEAVTQSASGAFGEVAWVDASFDRCGDSAKSGTKLRRRAW